MADLILRPSGRKPEDQKPWSLQLRYHDCCGPTECHTIAHVSDFTAYEIADAGEAFYLFGDPREEPE